MRRLKRILVTFLALLFSGCTTLEHDYLVYVGTYTGKGSHGIYAYRFNSVNGEMTPLGLAAKTENPSFLTIDSPGKFLYAVSETDSHNDEATGAISVFSINRECGALTLLQQVSSLGAAPCHLSLDRSGQYLLVANYVGGTAAVFPIRPDGKLGSSTAFIQCSGSSLNPNRQSGPHAHSIYSTPDNRFVMITDLGSDKILTYRFDAERGTLDPLLSGNVTMEPGSGPRHMTFSPSGKFAYVINELTSTITVFSLDGETGKMEVRGTLSALPETFAGTNTSAEITMSANGKFLYASNRGNDTIGLFGIDVNEGNLTPIGWFTSGGRTPRHMEVDPTGQWLLVANQNSDNLVLFRIDRSSGSLKSTSQSLSMVSPVCTRFVPAQ